MSNRSRPMPYDWMVKHTPQEEWIRGQGVFLWLAFFFSEIGAGVYFVSLFMNFPQGWLFGWLFALVLGGLFHLLFLGKRERALRMLAKPGCSELSRGLWVILLFTVVGFCQVAPSVVSALPWTGSTLAFKVIMGIICILMITHGFLTMNVVRAIPMWNSSMMIPLSLISGIWVGSQIVILLLRFTGHNIGAAEIWARWSLFCFIAFLGAFLLGAAHSSATVKLSIKGLVAGEWSGPFYIGVVAIGILIPVIITLVIWGKDINSLGAGSLLLRCVCVVVGDLTMRYSIMRNALYSPLI